MDPKTIFVVEDEKSIRLICKRLLARLGHETVFAGNVREAVALLPDIGHVDLLVTDMRLPDGDGVEVIVKLRERFPGVKILVITGSPMPGARLERFCELGLAEKDVLPKPFEIGRFVSVVQGCLFGRPRL